MSHMETRKLPPSGSPRETQTPGQMPGRAFVLTGWCGNVALVLEVMAFPEEQALPGLSGVLLTGAELSVAGGEVEKALIRLPGVDGITDGRLIRHNVLPNRWDYLFRCGSERREV